MALPESFLTFKFDEAYDSGLVNLVLYRQTEFPSAGICHLIN